MPGHVRSGPHDVRPGQNAAEVRSTWLSGPGLAVSALGLILAVGTASYIIVEGWGVWDAFYMTVTTVATVGFREVHPLSRGGAGGDGAC